MHALSIAATSRWRKQARSGDDLVADPQKWPLQVDGEVTAELRIKLPRGYSISVPRQPVLMANLLRNVSFRAKSA